MGRSEGMTYGWARTQILGATMNACFLLALALYIVLEAIPKFLFPEPLDSRGGLLPFSVYTIFISVASAGFIINLAGTIIFALLGTNAHGHSHGSGSHSHGAMKHKSKKASHGHSHSPRHPNIQSSSGDVDGLLHREELDDVERDHHAHLTDHETNKNHSGTDSNIKAVFLHYLGDALSSLCVLATGILFYFFPKAEWVKYLDPVSSLVIVAIILVTTIPFIREASSILLQSVPSEIDDIALQRAIDMVPGVQSSHDLHIWQLDDNMIIASVHIVILDCTSTEATKILSRVKQVFHKRGIHSCTLQFEYQLSPTPTQAQRQNMSNCQHCVQDCDADWCCKDADIPQDQAQIFEPYSDL